MNISELMVVSGSQSFRDRVRFCANKESLVVLSEADTVPTHAERLVCAKRVLKNEVVLDAFVLTCLVNPTISAYATEGNIPDGDIEFVVVTEFTRLALAGV